MAVIVGQVGGNDDLIFDGHSAAFDGAGRRRSRLASDVTVVDLASRAMVIAGEDFEPEAEVWSALVLGVRDYAARRASGRRSRRFPAGIDLGAHRGHRWRHAMGPGNVLGVLISC